jgi:D-3-phosphoglycerate dehydrogenase / 2-oxoglutarate reductase
MTKVLVSDPIDQAGIDILSQVAQVDVRTGLPPEELKAIIGDYDALMIRSGTTVTAEIIEAAESASTTSMCRRPPSAVCWW